jgi:hypothetical protein
MLIYNANIFQNTMHLLKRILTVSACALFYYLAFSLNKAIFDEYDFSFGVNWVFVPSGLQLVLVLTAVEDAALGITLASWLIGFLYYPLESDIRTMMTGVITGLSPVIARKISFDHLGIEADLRNLSFQAIVQMSFIFALLSAALHQLWFYYNGVSDKFIHSLMVMALGNVLGTLLVLSVIKITLATVKRKAQ